MRCLFALLLTTALGSLAYCAGANGLRIERPYEEALFRVALRTSAPTFPDPDAVWSEHPPLAYLVLRGCAAVAGDDLTLLRLLWASFFLLAFLILVCLSGPSTLRVTSKPTTPAKTSAPRAVPEASVPGQQGERAASEGTPRPGPHDRTAEAVRGVLVFALFTSPLVLVGGFRVGPDAVTYLTFAAYLACAVVFAQTQSGAAAAGVGIAGALLVYAHAYGWVYTVALTAALVIAFASRCRRALALKLLLVATIALAPLAIDHAAFASRIDLLRNHYWASSVGQGSSRVPLVGMWLPLTEVSFQHALLPVVAQIVTWLLLAWVVVRGHDPVARWLALAAFLCVPVFWLLERATESRMVIHHWLGLFAVMAVCALARGLGRPLLFACALGASCVLLIPGVSMAVLTVGEAQGAFEQAKVEIERQAEQSKVVVFGGTRVYIQLMPDLDAAVIDRCYVYLRTARAPDSFVGRKLIPPDRLVADEQWPSFPFERAVVVQFGASQQVNVPHNGWGVVDQARFVHNSITVGEILVETRRRQ